MSDCDGYTSDSECDTPGSLHDFINDQCSWSDDVSYDTVDTVEIVESYYNENGKRRSTRERRGVERYLDEHHIELLLEGESEDILIDTSTETETSDEGSCWEGSDSWEEEEEDEEVEEVIREITHNIRNAMDEEDDNA
tara:strand:+ start:552 stop:965 length:414 start_codon:yes stop_codon:yes gene_type:complete